MVLSVLKCAASTRLASGCRWLSMAKAGMRRYSSQEGSAQTSAALDDRPMLADNLDIRDTTEAKRVPRQKQEPKPIPTPSLPEFAGPSPSRRAALALQVPEAIPTMHAGHQARLPLDLEPRQRRRLEESWEPELQKEFRLAFQQASQTLQEQQAEEGQRQWLSIVRKLQGRWEADNPEGTTAPQNHVIEEVGGVLKTWRSDRPSQQAELWLSRDGIVMLGKGNVQLDMATVGSRSIRWKRRHGDVWEWRWMGDTEPTPFGHLWCSLPWQNIAKPRGPEKRKALVYKRLGHLILAAAHRHYLEKLVPRTPPSALDYWKEVCRTVERENRAANIVTVAAELATFEDRVHDGNSFLVGYAERFWRRADFQVSATNGILLSHPALQEKVANEGWGFNHWKQEKLSQDEVVNFMRHMNVQGLTHSEVRLWPRPFRRTERASPEQIEEAVQKVLKLVGQAEELSWHKLRALLADRGFFSTRRQQEETGGSLETATDLNPPENNFLKLCGLADALPSYESTDCVYLKNFALASMQHALRQQVFVVLS
ncbi:unnamed protein product [Symbiodinium sp. CCMP2456]|nr:unnamed protein product [Symbiodinium sp. CCMP2456]